MGGNRKGTGRVDFDKLRVMWGEGKTCQQIGDELGCSAPYVSATAKQLGLPRRVGGYTRIDMALLEDMLIRGKSVADIAEHYGCGESTVYRHMEYNGITPPKREAPAPVEPPPRPAPPKIDTSTVTGRLIASKGRWSELDKIRQAQGWTTTQVQQRYHQAVRAGA